MNVSELFQLTRWVEANVAGKRLQKLYGALHGVLQSNTQPGQAKQAFSDQQHNLAEALRGMNLSQLTLEQLDFLDRLALGKHLGQRGIEQLENILYRHQLDPATAAARVGEIVNEVQQAVAKITQIKGGLEGLVDVSPAPEGEALLRVDFTREASMKDVEDFKKWGADWHDIGRGIAMIHGRSPKDIRVVGASTGSIIIELAVAYVIARTVSAIILEAGKVAEKVLHLRKKAEELRGMRLQNDRIAKDLEAESEAQRAKGIAEITSRVIGELGKKADGEETKVLETAVRKLLSFTEKGGEVDCVLPELPAADAKADNEADKEKLAELRQLQAAFKEVRMMEDKIRRLEHKPD